MKLMPKRVVIRTGSIIALIRKCTRPWEIAKQIYRYISISSGGLRKAKVHVYQDDFIRNAAETRRFAIHHFITELHPCTFK